MKTVFGLVIFFSIISVESGSACTTFFLSKNGQMAFGKNYDWMTGIGSVNTNLRGLSKSSLAIDGGNILRWVSKYGSTTFNQYGKEFPNGGMNEKGLVVELMWLSESRYPAKDQRPGLSVLQWIQYQLDNCSTVDEVIATDKIQRIISTGTPQHYLVADAKGDVATIEFLAGKMVVHRSTALPHPVLANSTYEESVKVLGRKKSGDNSKDRFSTACQMVQHYKETETGKPIIDYSFQILEKVAQPGFTKWSIVYDITNMKIYFKTTDRVQQKMIETDRFNYNCSSRPAFYNLERDDTGDITSRFVAFNNETNSKMLKEAFRQSPGLGIDQPLQDALGEFARAVRCRL